MLRTIILGLATIGFGFVTFSSCKMSCVPIPVSELPAPVEAKIEVPEGVAVFTDSEIDMVLRHRRNGERNEDIIEHPSKSEWEIMASEPGVVSMVIYNDWREIEHYNFRRDGKIYWFRTPDQIDLSSFGSSYSVGKRVIDRERMTLTVHAYDGESAKTILAGVGGLAAFAITLVLFLFTAGSFSDWRQVRGSSKAVESIG